MSLMKPGSSRKRISSQGVKDSLELACFFLMASLCQVLSLHQVLLFSSPKPDSFIIQNPTHQSGEGPVIQVSFSIPKEEITRKRKFGEHLCLGFLASITFQEVEEWHRRSKGSKFFGCLGKLNISIAKWSVCRGIRGSEGK